MYIFQKMGINYSRECINNSNFKVEDIQEWYPQAKVINSELIEKRSFSVFLDRVTECIFLTYFGGLDFF